MPTVLVDVDSAPRPSRAYTIEVGAGTLRSIGERLRGLDRPYDVFVVTDSNVGPLYVGTIRESLSAESVRSHVETVPAGESTKNLETYQRLLGALHDFDQINPLLVVALGGGMIGDLAGFVAATYERGIPYVQVPTSLLAQTDSSVGGKTVVDYRGVKNLVGAFHQPCFVLIDVAVLQTLPDREFRSGLAEVIKHGAALDADFFSVIERDREAILSQDADTLVRVVHRSVELKAEVVVKDELDQLGERAKLNFGHTFGHAIEAASGFGLLHGEAVAIGMCCAADLACQMEMCTQEDAVRIESLLDSVGLPTRWLRGSVDAAMSAMRRDKKFVWGTPRFVLPVGIGEVKLVSDVDLDVARTTLEGRLDA
ncbi:MAG: 3-dehydroquinate synthase [Armatimonadota bacterium]